MTAPNLWNDEAPESIYTPDVVPVTCPFCGMTPNTWTHSEEFEGDTLWRAETSCHECGATGPRPEDNYIFRDEDIYVDFEVEREVVNYSIMLWNKRAK